MRMATIDAGEEHSRYVGRIYQEYYAGLRYYFLSQLGDASEADACVQKAFSLLFFFMKDRCWETDAEYVHVYLMRIAGQLCSKKLATKRARRKNRLGLDRAESLLHKIIDGVIQPARERLASFNSFVGRTAATASRG
jgi:DNA-directed RNA polymerase specialized sigma24 family protein